MKWNQTKLAEEIGVTRASVSQWELGRIQPSKKRIPKLEKVLNIQLGDIWMGQATPFNTPSIDARLRALDPQVSKGLIAAFNQMIDAINQGRKNNQDEDR